MILLTDGRLNGNGNTPEETVKTAKRNLPAVMKFFNVRHYEFMRAQDGMLIDAYKSFEKIDFSDYDYVVMPHGHDAHKDHVVPQVFFRRLRKEKKNIRAKAVIMKFGRRCRNRRIIWTFPKRLRSSVRQ